MPPATAAALRDDAGSAKGESNIHGLPNLWFYDGLAVPQPDYLNFPGKETQRAPYKFSQ